MDVMTALTAFQTSSVLMAAGELDLFTFILKNGAPMPLEELAQAAECHPASLASLTSALLSLGFLEQESGKFSVPAPWREILDSRSPETIIPLIQHWAGCQRNWSQLAYAVKTGFPIPRQAGVLGPLGDFRAFVQAMDVIARRLAGPITAKMKEAGLLEFREMLDLGGASGTYTFAFLESNPAGRATIYDRAIALAEARKRTETSGFADRVSFLAGDFNKEELPVNRYDLVWISAIIHSETVPQTAALFRKVFSALTPGGRVAIRDVYYNADRTGPPAAAMFDINMLAGVPGGRVYTQQEVFTLLGRAGFVNARLAIPADDMGAVIAAEKAPA